MLREPLMCATLINSVPHPQFTAARYIQLYVLVVLRYQFTTRECLHACLPRRRLTHDLTDALRGQLVNYN